MLLRPQLNNYLVAVRIAVKNGVGVEERAATTKFKFFPRMIVMERFLKITHVNARLLQ